MWSNVAASPVSAFVTVAFVPLQSPAARVVVVAPEPAAGFALEVLLPELQAVPTEHPEAEESPGDDPLRASHVLPS